VITRRGCQLHRDEQGWLFWSFLGRVVSRDVGRVPMTFFVA
jgi:hypothetical protein